MHGPTYNVALDERALCMRAYNIINPRRVGGTNQPSHCTVEPPSRMLRKFGLESRLTVYSSKFRLVLVGHGPTVPDGKSGNTLI